jgi:hypothetical protein
MEVTFISNVVFRRIKLPFWQVWFSCRMSGGLQDSFFFSFLRGVFLPVVVLFLLLLLSLLMWSLLSLQLLLLSLLLQCLLQQQMSLQPPLSTAAAAVVNCCCCLVAAAAVVTAGCRCRCCCSFRYHCVFTGEAEAAGIVGMDTAAAVTLELSW